MRFFFSFLLLQLSFVFSLPISAAGGDYRPLLKVGKAWDWYCRAATYAHEWNRHYAVVGDTIVDGERCYKIATKETELSTGEVVSEGESKHGMYIQNGKKIMK